MTPTTKLNSGQQTRKHAPLQCGRCGRWLGKDGYPRAVYDEWNGGWEVDPLCGPCGRKQGFKDMRQA